VPATHGVDQEIEIAGGARLGMKADRMGADDQEPHVTVDEFLQ